MSNDDATICRNFIVGEEPKRAHFNRVGKGRWGGWGGSGGGLSASTGTFRLSYGITSDGGKVNANILWSYEHYPLAYRYKDKNGGSAILLNGDGAPSNTTAGQMRELRAVARRHARTALLPFSALRAAGIEAGDFEEIEIIETTPDQQDTVWRRCARKECSYAGEVSDYSRPNGKGHEHASTVHFLGETLFRYKKAFYVCGLDRNDDPRRRNFFLARLPMKLRKNPKTVDEALQALRPKTLPEGTLRQGEYFLVESPDKKPKAKEIIKKSNTGHWQRSDKPGVPIISDETGNMARALADDQRPLAERATRHRASQLYLNGHVYVRGMLRDSQHGAMKLGDGKTWYRVVKNLADGSWGASSGGLGRGRVD